MLSKDLVSRFLSYLVDIFLSVERTGESNLFASEDLHPLSFQQGLGNKGSQPSFHVTSSIDEHRLEDERTIKLSPYRGKYQTLIIIPGSK